MIWLKKEILFILSALLILFVSCESVRSKTEIRSEEQEIVSQEDLVSSFFVQIQDWNSDSIPKIDSLGFEISQMDSALTFHPYENEYETRSFAFSTKNKSEFNVFEESEYLKQSKPIQQSVYKVWRKKLRNLEILDLSIEPHPSLGWLFVVRKRGQE